MRRVPVLLALLLLSGGCFSCTIWKNPPRGWGGATGGEQLERQLWKEISQQHWSSVQRHLASNFTLTTPAGFYGPKEALEFWKQLQLQDYSLGNFQLQPNGADVTVAYTISVSGSNGSGDGPASGGVPAYVMSVWQEVGTRWLLIAQSMHPARKTP